MSVPDKLHFGCFDAILPGWLNTDITSHLFISRVPGLPPLLHRLGILNEKRYRQHRAGIFRQVHYLNLTKRFPLRSDSFVAAFSSHVLEHLYPAQAASCLKEVYRVLKSGSIVRVAVPDLDQLIQGYDPACADSWVETFFESRQANAKNQHHWHYNFDSLRDLLERAGFVDARRCAYRQGRCPDLQLIDNRPESLFVEALKP